MALVVVELSAVKLRRVDEPVIKRLARVERPVKVLAPLKVFESPRRVVEAEPPPQPTQEPTVSVPIVAVLVLKSVVEALVAKKFVVVAEVPVARTKVKFWRVEEPVERRLPTVARLVTSSVVKVPLFPLTALAFKVPVMMRFPSLEIELLRLWK